MDGLKVPSVLSHVAEGTGAGVNRRAYTRVRPPTTEVGLIIV